MLNKFTKNAKLTIGDNMKNIKFIIAIVITAMVCTTVGVVAANQIQANQIGYTKNGVNTTVDQALNDLYILTNKTISLSDPVYSESSVKFLKDLLMYSLEIPPSTLNKILSSS